MYAGSGCWEWCPEDVGILCVEIFKKVLDKGIVLCYNTLALKKCVLNIAE